MEFDWIAPSGRALLTSFQADHYSAGWWMDAAPTLEAAEAEVHRLFTELATMAATKNVMLPVGTDYSPPNKWVSAIQRDWNSRYVWPKFTMAIPREYFDAVRAAQAATGRPFSPQTRDMNPIYTGKDVSFIDTKQMQRAAENTLLGAEKFATIAALTGARFPTEPIDKAWRQLLFGAHHDGITGSESDQVYLDLIGGWREALELGTTVLDGAIEHLAAQIETAGDGQAVTVFNALSWSRTDIARVEVDLPDDRIPWARPGRRCRRARPVRGRIGRSARVGRAGPGDDRVPRPRRARRRLPDVPRAARLDPARARPAGGRSTRWPSRTRPSPCRSIRPAAAGSPACVDKRSGKQLIRPGEVANELRSYREYPNHPLFAEGPWHLTPDGRFTSAIDFETEVTVEVSPIGQRIRLHGPFEASRREQEIRLWTGIDRVELTTSIHDYDSHDRLFRLRFPAAVEGGAPVSETGNAVIGRPFGRPNVDVAEVPFTLDHPAYNWFALGATARVALGAPGAPVSEARAARAIGVAEVVVPDDPRQDDAVRELVIALVRQGVTSTVSRHDGHRYGVLHIDSNLPDVRLAIGRADDNRFVAAVLDGADPGYRTEFDRQLASGGRARLWVPEDGDARRRAEPITDLRGARDLPVLIVAGVDADHMAAALDALVADLEDGVIAVDQPAELDGPTGTTEDYTVAVINRGMPSFNVEADGNLYLSIMRSCSGWPSGVWIDPPRRSTPDGANFQFQHWSHTFDYAIAAAPGDWREGGIVQRRTRLQQSARRPGVRRPPGPPARDGGLPRGRAGVGRPDRPQARRRPAGADGRDGARPGARHRAAPVRIVGPTHPGDDPKSVADRRPSPGRTCSRRTPRRCRAPGPTHRGAPRAVRDRDPRRDARGDGRTGRRSGRPGPAGRGGPAGLLRLLAAQQGCRADGLPVGHGPDQAVLPGRRGAVRRADRRRLRAHRRCGRRIGRAHRPARLGGDARPSGSTAWRRARTSPSRRPFGRPPGRPPGAISWPRGSPMRRARPTRTW